MEGRTRLAAYAFCLNEGAILLCRISNVGGHTGEWTLPGGGLDWGEDPRDGMHRELREETGLRGEVQSVLGVDSLVLPANESDHLEAVQSVRIVYEVDCDGEPSVVEVDGTVDEARWVPLSDLGEYPVVSLVSFALEQAGIG